MKPTSRTVRSLKPCVKAIHLCMVIGEKMKTLSHVLLLPNYGMQGDAHAGVGKENQILISRWDVLQRFKLAAGAIGDHITTHGILIDTLPRGTKLDVGDAIIELSSLFEPGDELNAVRPGLADELSGRGAMWANVVKGGYVKVNDKVNLRFD